MAVKLILRSLSATSSSGAADTTWRSDLCQALGVSASEAVLAQLLPVWNSLDRLAAAMTPTELKELVAHVPHALAPLQSSKTGSLEVSVVNDITTPLKTSVWV